jgi:hypothetical protein
MHYLKFNFRINIIYYENFRKFSNKYMSQAAQGRKKKYLPVLIIVIVAIAVAAGYVRLYFLFAEKTINAPFYSALASISKPTKIDPVVFGHSTEGKPIEGYVVGSGPDTILLMAAIHGNETGTADLLNQLVAEIKADPSIVSKTKRLVIMPVANPDGYDIAKKMNANGVNLNLNFDTPRWTNWGPEGTYAGPKPFSEVETQVIRQVVLQYKPDMMISYHAQGALVTPEEFSSSITLAKWYSTETGYKYEDTSNSDWNFWGTATLWFADTTGGPAITVELTTLTGGDWDINKQALNDLISSSDDLLSN